MFDMDSQGQSLSLREEGLFKCQQSPKFIFEAALSPDY